MSTAWSRKNCDKNICMLNSSPFSVSCHLFSLFFRLTNNNSVQTSICGHSTWTHQHTHSAHTVHTEGGRERETGAHNSIQFAGLMWHLSTEPTENYRITRTLIESQDDERKDEGWKSDGQAGSTSQTRDQQCSLCMYVCLSVCLCVWHKIIVAFASSIAKANGVQVTTFSMRMRSQSHP